MKRFTILQKRATLYSLLFLLLGLFSVNSLYAQRPVRAHNIGTGGDLIIAPTNTNNYAYDYYVTGTTTVNRIIVGAGYKGKITLDGVNITVGNTGTPFSTGVTAPCGNGTNLVKTGSCIAIMGQNGVNTNQSPVTHVQIVLKGNNVLRQNGNAGYCGIQVDQGAQIYISAVNPDDNSSGILFANTMATTSTDPNLPPVKGTACQAGAAIGAMHGMGGHTGVLYNGNQGEVVSIIQGSAATPCPPPAGTGAGQTSTTTYWTSGGNIIITSGTITAWGGHASGIGGGFRAYYDGAVIITGGVIRSYAGIHGAGIGGGCPFGGVTSGGVTAITNCMAKNSAVIVLPPAKIESYGAAGAPYSSDPALALIGTEYVAYVNDPAKPLMNIHCVDYQPFVPIYLDFTQDPGLKAIFDAIFPSFSLNKVLIGYTDAAGIIPLHGLFVFPVTFFTTVSSIAPSTWGRPYLPVNKTVLNGGEIILPLLQTCIEFTDQWAYPLYEGYSPAQARANAYRLKIEYCEPQLTVNGVNWMLQDMDMFKKLIFLDANENVLPSPPTQFKPGDVFYVVIPIEQGWPRGYYNDILLIGAQWPGVANPNLLSSYLRRIGRQRVIAFDDTKTNSNICVSTTNKSFTVNYPPDPATTMVPLTLWIQHNGLNTSLYDPNLVDAVYYITTQPTFEGALAEKPHYLWTPLKVPVQNNGTAVTNVYFNNLPPGVYYIHWIVASGITFAHSQDYKTPNLYDCGGYGQYIIKSNNVYAGGITAPEEVCSGYPANLTATPASGGGGPYYYQWYSGPSATGPWTAISGAFSTANQNYTTGNLTTPTYYRRGVIDGSPTPGTVYYTEPFLVHVSQILTPTFNFQTQYCLNATPATLPLTSVNGVPGTWSPSAITTNTAGQKDYVFTPAAGRCANPITVKVTVSATLVPAFGFQTSYCRNALPATLPATSTNGITGTWSPATINTGIIGTANYVFTPTAGQCTSGTVTIPVTVTATIDPTFNFQTTYCKDATPAALPGISTNGVPGTWNPTKISTTTAGTADYTFTPTSGYCAGTGPYKVTVTVTAPITPTFNIPNTLTYCKGETPVSLPTTSSNGLLGTWKPATISTTTVGGPTNYVFTPNSGQCATGNYTVSVTVNNTTEPTFSFTTTYCQGDVPATLLPNSANGIAGTWSPAAISTATVGTTNYLFTPTNTCYPPKTVAVKVNAKIDAQFSFKTQYCTGEVPAALPSSSNNGVTGTWSPSNTISTANAGTTTYTFTPTAGQCTTGAKSFQVTVTQTKTPTFSFQTDYCTGNTPDALPNISNNEVPGTWIPSTITTTSVGTKTYTFTPNTGVCAPSVNVPVTVASTRTPVFTSVKLEYCSTELPLTLPLTSDNGITGSWNPTQITGAGTYTFTPTGGQCTSGTTSITVSVATSIAPTFTTMKKVFCQGEPEYTLPQMSDNGIPGIWTLNSNPVTSISTAIPNSYTYIFTANSGYCATPNIVHVSVTVTALKTPTFAFNLQYCKGEKPPKLSATSVNGVQGTWTPDTIMTGVVGRTPYTFTPAAGECVTGIVTLMVEVVSPVAEFNFKTEYCQGVDPDLLPGTSINGITGTWNPPTISTLTTGTKNYTFTPNNPAQCSSGQVVVTVRVNTTLTPDFGSVRREYCQGSGNFTLPAVSDNGIAGTWSPSATITTGAAGTTSYIFTPAHGICVSGTVELIVRVTASIAPEFSFPTTFCNGSTPYPLPRMSDNGITGTWSPTTISTTASGTYTFTPDGGQCASTKSVTTTITAPLDPTFASLLNPVCLGSSQPLPLVSDQGIQGSWNPAFLSATALGSFTYTFTPSPGQCAPGSKTFTINVQGATLKPLTYSQYEYSSTDAGTFAPSWTAPIGTGNFINGTYTIAPSSGLPINATTGVISPFGATAGEYVITYTTLNPCPASVSTTVKIVTAKACTYTEILYYRQRQDDAKRIPYPACNANFTNQGTNEYYPVGPGIPAPSGSGSNISMGGGTWTINPPLNTTYFKDGIIYTPGGLMPTEGEYEVTFTPTYDPVNGGGCPTTYKITFMPNTSTATIAYQGPFCFDEPGPKPVTKTNETGHKTGTFSATPAGLNINPLTGEIFPDQSVPGTYTVTYTIAPILLCGAGSASTTVTIRSTTLRTRTITGPTTICRGSTAPVNYSIVQDGTTTYTWSYVGEGWSHSGALTGTNITLIPGTGNATIYVMGVPQCGAAGLVATLDVYFANPPAKPVIEGPNNICGGASGLEYKVAPVSGITYNWSITGTGWTPTSGTGSSMFLTSGLVPGTITVTPNNGNCAGPSATMNVTVIVPKTDQLQAITGNTFPCLGDAPVYTTPALSPGFVYDWSVPAGWEITGMNTSSPISINTQTSSVSARIGDVYLKALSQCSVTDKSLRVMLNEPPVLGEIEAPNSFCEGTTDNFLTAIKSPFYADATYVWTLISGTGMTLYNANQQTAQLAVQGSATGRVSVYAYNACGQSQTVYKDIVVRPMAMTNDFVVHNAYICSGGTQDLRELVESATGEEHDFEHSVLRFYADEFTPNPIINPIVTLTNTTEFWASYEDENFCPGIRQKLIVYVAATPASISVNATACEGDTRTLTVVGGSSQTYEWGIGNCGENPLVGKTGSTITTAPLTPPSVKYWVRGADPGCVTGCVFTTLTINAKPTVLQKNSCE